MLHGRDRDAATDELGDKLAEEGGLAGAAPSAEPQNLHRAIFME
jgi:hypothetical protein